MAINDESALPDFGRAGLSWWDWFKLLAMKDLLGRWDLTIGTGADCYPSWVELKPNGGQFVGRVGSARPIETVRYGKDTVTFSLPPQYEGRKDNLAFQATIRRDVLEGTTTIEDGSTVSWVGKRAPALPELAPNWREPVDLIQADLSNWTLRSPDWESHWSIEDGMLVNAKAGSDLITVNKYGDFRLIAEYKYPKGSNSGIYLRGRYEFQIVDDYESGANGVGNSGAIYGFLAPTKNAVLAPEEWNTAEITFLGRFVTVVLNGETIIDNKEIPGITGGALDSDEGNPGPLFVQGDHGPVTFRRLTLYPSVRPFSH